MATRAVATTITFRAWDTAANAPKTGDNANFTLSWIKDGTRAAPTNASSEVDAANAPGIYKITLTAAETDCVCGAFAGKSSTASVSLFGPEIAFDYVPTAATTYGAFIGNATAALAVDATGRVDLGKILGTASQGAAGYVGIDWAKVLNPTTALALTATTISATQVVASVTGAVGSVTGAVGSVTGNVGGNVNGNVVGSTGSVTGLNPALIDVATSTRLAAAAYTAPDNAGITAIGNYLTGTINPNILGVPGAVWDVVLAGHLTPGSTGAALNAAGAAGDPWQTFLPGAYVAGQAGYIVGNQAVTLPASIFNTVLDGAYTFAQTQRMVNSSVLALLSGAVAGGTGTVTVKSIDGTKTRFTWNYDANGNRTQFLPINTAL